MSKNSFTAILVAVVLAACGAAPALAQQSANPLAVPVLFDNQTGLDPSQIYIQFMGGHPVGGTYKDTLNGNTTNLSGAPSQFYSLAQLQGLGTF
ncbi:MAG: hypothetical protein ACKOLA_11125, partial [Spartobacteria bacterium]